MALTAICGELPAELLPRLYPRQSYLDKVIRLLLSDKLIRVYYRDKLRGYRLSQKAKDFLLYDNPERFTLYLTGNAETNQLKSEPVRRLRLHRLAESYVLMLNGGVTIYRDLKPDVFSPDGCAVRKLTTPCFYTSREIKQMGMETVKISGSRMMGVLLAPTGAYLTYNSGNSFSKWDYRAEQRAKALLKSTICYERLNEQYKPEHLNGLLLGSGLELFNQIMTTADSNARCFFLLDGSYEHFYYLTNDRYGEVLVKLLCAPAKLAALERIISQDLLPKQPELPIENDAVDMNGNPVLFAYFLDIPRINRFCNGIQLYGRQGTLICFDFQSEALRSFFGSKVQIQAIRFDKFERSFFNPQTQPH